MTELVCIVCPKGCRLHVDETDGFKVTGNGCERGAKYGFDELTAPTRVVTSTVRIRGAQHPRCPVKTERAVAKSKIFEVMAVLDNVELTSPVKTGDIVVENVCGTGVNIVVSRSM